MANKEDKKWLTPLVWSQIKGTNPYFVPVRGSNFKFLTKSSGNKAVGKLWPVLVYAGRMWAGTSGKNLAM